MNDHPTNEDLTTLLEAHREGGFGERITHLLRCARCRDRLLAKIDGLEAGRGEARVLRFERPAGVASPTAAQEVLPLESLGFGESLDRWFSRALSAGRAEEVRAQGLIEELLSLSEIARRRLALEDPRFYSWTLAARLLDESRSRGVRRPRHGEKLARLALDLLGRLDSGRYGERLIRDLQARGWAVLGNSLRLAGDLMGADRAFQCGLEFLAGSFDPFEKAELLGLLGSLRRDQRRFDEALEALDEAQDLLEEIHEIRRIPRILVKKGFLWLARAEPARALDLLQEAQRGLEPGQDLRTELAIRHNLAICHLELERYSEARRIFRDNQALYARFTDRGTRLRIKWLEGALAVEAGRADRGEALLQEVRAAYIEAEKGYEAAFVSLELATLYARQKRYAELRSLAREMAGVFFAHQIHREGVLALAYLRQAAERETLSAEAIRRLSGYLKKSRFEPGCELEELQ